MAALATGATADELRVVTFGTSLTARGGWQEALRHQLAERLERPVVVSTVALSGATSDWAVGAPPRVVAERPDVVLVEFHANDGALNRLVTPAHSRANMDTIVATLRRECPDALVVVMAMNPMHGLRGAVRPFMSRYVDAHRAVAADHGVLFLDHGPAWARLSTAERDAAIPDGAHPLPEAAISVIVPGIVDLLAAHLHSTTSHPQQRRPE